MIDHGYMSYEWVNNRVGKKTGSPGCVRVFFCCHIYVLHTYNIYSIYIVNVIGVTMCALIARVCSLIIMALPLTWSVHGQTRFSGNASL